METGDPFFQDDGGPSLRVPGARAIKREKRIAERGHSCASRENQVAIGRLQDEGGPSLRVQGERFGGRHFCCLRGPSLRVQGELPARRVPDQTKRAIPARAGRTLGHGSVSTHTPGHPCACRENRMSSPCSASSLGPSLRVQGELSCPFVLKPQHRAIPARAGRTQLPCSPF